MSHRALVIRLMTFFIFCVCGLSNAATTSLNLLPHTFVNTAPVASSPQTQANLNHFSTVRVGTWLPAQSPFVVVIDPHNFEGLTADYLGLLERALNLPFVVQQYPDQQSALDALKSGEIDLLTANQALANSHPDLLASAVYFNDHSVLVSQQALAQPLNRELAGKTLLYRDNSPLRAALHAAYPQATLVANHDDYAAMAAVAESDDVLLWTNAVTAEEINNRIYNKRLVITPSQVEPELGVNFLAQPSSSPLIDAINLILAQLSHQTQAQIAETWQVNLPDITPAAPLELSREERDWVAKHPPISVLLVNTHIPMTFINDEGEQSGFTVALLKKIGQQSGLNFTWLPFDNLIGMRAYLKQHPTALIAAADASANQDPEIAYSRPYQISNWVLVTRKNFPTVKSLADMAGNKVAVFTGSYYLPALREQFPQVEFVESDFSLETAFSLLTHRLDGAIVPQGAANFVLKSYLEDRFRVAAVAPIPPLRLAMATGSENRELLSIINKALIQTSPRAMEIQFNGWQMRYALERFEIWGRYRTAIVATICGTLAIALLLAFYYWRNRFLKRNLALQEKLQEALQAAKTQVEKASESKSVFLSQMSHEIRTPMNALIGLLELENSGKSSPQQRKNNIAVAWDSAKSLLMLVGDILDMAKIESGTYSVRRVPVSLSATLNSVSTLFRISAEQKGLALRTSTEVTDDVIVFDPIMLKQIVSNLLSNAIKFTDEGNVEVVIYQAAKVGNERGDYVLEVIDSGVGLTPDQQRAIFEPFVQVEEQQANHKGTGLGLSICRQLAQLLNGTLEVESEPGEGTTFIFRFSAPRGDALPSEPNLPLRETTHSLNILLVDDHPPNRLLLGQQLEFAGHRSVAAENGAQALHLWETATPSFDLLITDCNMPEMSGFELVRQLRQKERQAGREPQPMFGLTAMAEKEVMVQAKQAGMTDCLFKPVELVQLLAHINALNAGASPSSSIDPHIVLSLEKLAQSQPENYRLLILSSIKQNRTDIANIKCAMAAHDVMQIKSSAHSLSGGARLIHADALADISRQLEHRAGDENLDEIQKLAVECEILVIQLEKELTQQLPEQPV